MVESGMENGNRQAAAKPSPEQVRLEIFRTVTLMRSCCDNALDSWAEHVELANLASGIYVPGPGKATPQQLAEGARQLGQNADGALNKLLELGARLHSICVPKQDKPLFRHAHNCAARR